jgi:hypothetical protein
MSVEGIDVKDLHEELAGAVPGSPEEKAVLGKLRDRREQKTDEFRVVRNANMSEAAHEGVVRGREAQHAAKVAIEQVTGEHEIPVDVIDRPEQMH